MESVSGQNTRKGGLSDSCPNKGLILQQTQALNTAKHHAWQNNKQSSSLLDWGTQISALISSRAAHLATKRQHCQAAHAHCTYAQDRQLSHVWSDKLIYLTDMLSRCWLLFATANPMLPGIKQPSIAWSWGYKVVHENGKNTKMVHENKKKHEVYTSSQSTQLRTGQRRLERTW